MTESTSPLGLKSEPRTYTIQLSDIDAFDRAIPGARGAERSTLATPNSFPLTFPITWHPSPIIGLDLPDAGLIHGEQRFRYGAPIPAGATVTVISEVTGYKERAETAFITLTTYGTNADGVMVFEAQSLVMAPRGFSEDRT